MNKHEIIEDEPEETDVIQISNKPGYSPSRTRGLKPSPLAGPKLRPGEVSTGLRVRVPNQKVADAWTALGTEGRGQVAALWYAGTLLQGLGPDRLETPEGKELLALLTLLRPSS